MTMMKSATAIRKEALRVGDELMIGSNSFVTFTVRSG